MTEHGSANRFVRSWRGKERAYKVFWFYAVPINLVFYVLGAIAGYVAATNPAVSMLILVAAPVYLVFLAWFCVSLWRCAFNVGWSGWGYLSRGWVALVVVGIGAQLFSVIA